MSNLSDDLTVVGFAPRIMATRTALTAIDSALLRCLRDRETSIRVLSPLERFHDVDADYNFASDEEDRILGLFDKRRNHIVLRDVSAATISHEAFHAIDSELGEKGRFRSHDDRAIVAAFKAHQKDGLFVSAYSSVAIHEFAAEAGRAILGFSTSATLRKRSDADRLRMIDPAVVTAIESMIVELRSRYGPTNPAPPPVPGTAAPKAASSEFGAFA